MTNALMKGIPVLLPSFPEQRKIADCLTSLDDVIAKAKDELDAWRELKKGLFQQMFVQTSTARRSIGAAFEFIPEDLQLIPTDTMKVTADIFERELFISLV